jgi:hypothetical protein
LVFGEEGCVGVDGNVSGVGANAGGGFVDHIRPCWTTFRVRG